MEYLSQPRGNESWVVRAWLCVLAGAETWGQLEAAETKVGPREEQAFAVSGCLFTCASSLLNFWPLKCNLQPPASPHLFFILPPSFPCSFTSSLTHYLTNSLSRSFTYLPTFPFVLPPSHPPKASLRSPLFGYLSSLSVLSCMFPCYFSSPKAMNVALLYCGFGVSLFRD